MKKVVIASNNPVKIKAVKSGFKKMFPRQKFKFINLSVSSDVPKQPLSDEETFTGAKNRVHNASKKIKDADFYVGIESGVDYIGDEMITFAWVVVKSGNKYGKARTGSFFLPPKIANLINEGKELGEADDIIFKTKNSKQKNGAIGILTGNVIDRTKSFTDAVILSLIPFKNADLY
uniref:Probable inosine/xanthosine triphosphatase n=1 Tax=candidate division CPR3 bacterium TaxID=2268181 RepID=A0A7C5YW26_UNCC3